MDKFKSAIIKGYTYLFKSKKKVSEFLSIPEYYNSIDTLPALNWHNIKETNNPKYLLKSKGNINLVDVAGVQFNLEKEFFEAFGVTAEFKKWYRLEIEYQILMVKALLTNDGTHRTFAHVAKAEANDLFQALQGGSFNESVAIVSKYIGCQVDPATTSTRQFYSYLQLMRRG